LDVAGSVDPATLTKILLSERLPLHCGGAVSSSRPRRLSRWSSWFQRPGRTMRDAASRPVITAALRAAGWRDCLAVPVWIKGREAGMLAVYDRSGFADLDEADVAIIEAFSREVAAALQRAALIDEIVGARRDAARIVESSNDGIVTIAEDGSVLTWNRAFAALTGHSRDQILGPGGLGLLDARDAGGEPVRLARWAPEADSTALLPDEVSVRAVDGGRRWLSCSYARTNRDDGESALLVVIARDVTDLRRQRALIAGQGHVMELIASGESLVISLTAVADLVSHQLECSAAILLADHDSSDELRVVARADVRAGCGEPDLRPPVEAKVISVVTAGLAELRVPPAGMPVTMGPYRVLPVFDAQDQVDGVIVVEAGSVQTFDVHGLQVLRTAIRLTEVAVDRETARKRLTYQASHDPLTGLPNRTVFLDRCAHALQTAGRHQELAVVLFVDLDRFKMINDSLGHDGHHRSIRRRRIHHLVRATADPRRCPDPRRAGAGSLRGAIPDGWA